ncbi:hypothetical protein Tco_1271797, partial [Tanacetum coccineum]
MIPSTRVKDAIAASGSKPRSNTKKDTTLPAKSDKKKVEDHSRNNKSNVKQKNHVDSRISYKCTVINSNSNPVCKTCNKCLISFNNDKCVVKSLKFVTKLPVNMVWRVKQVKTPTKIGDPTYQTLHIRLFSNAGHTDRPLVFGFRLLKTYDGESLTAHEFHEKVHQDRQFCDSDLEVAFRKHSCYVRTKDGVDLLK